MCRWSEIGDKAGYYSLGIQQKVGFVYEKLPLDVYALYLDHNDQHLKNADDDDSDELENYGHDEDDDSDEEEDEDGESKFIV